ncbi:hypothetical protein CO115_00825 [Candidatus Falkowbacteria bacterium CG_4_9_14_3_um_filter_36_9]|uniref:Uncharacterized protein n=2 Tax=Candidatus Falkowiibacteriota TaxID=1752728 RepID=A0A1J4T6J3_9BACT|nr:MAG: hypothetical protein AUJ27_03280 [Candidatus Falkowbacteria bacterium CG1_02_37_44]PIV50487.1 MAG: hypothetical protein COS18_04860 [Candidatus Falkowbacteria bacterium CG02_land_8_20_14_3_00_36_14]PIX11115.1 MAG: hypothetical protein COZ73_03530 [Candidatus Falkowbacteria bacterium CG_4_8_14_3_um_filter_36_11]PJA10574.1 MAG: hypothetical protein COX67_04240 [Candidatus Falkowbacteria bacterium CG_4_10_14_0_2_um_filter_36_22]PJB20714.1 MAG: hypothetical protein CO115_00825 [Candidatus F
MKKKTEEEILNEFKKEVKEYKIKTKGMTKAEKSRKFFRISEDTMKEMQAQSRFCFRGLLP